MDLGIEELELGWQATGLVWPVRAWGSYRRGVSVGAVHFYVDDYRFRRAAREPGVVRARVAVEMNFSTHVGMSRWEALYGIGLKRRCAASWGRSGMGLVVDLNVDPAFYDLALLGIPRGWGAFATRWHRDLGMKHLDDCYLLARSVGEPGLFVVFGGGERVRGVVEERGWVWWPDHSGTWEPGWRTGYGRRVGGCGERREGVAGVEREGAADGA